MNKNFKKRKPFALVQSGPKVVVATDTETVYHYRGFAYTFNYKHSEGEQEFMKSKIKSDTLCHMANLNQE